MTPTGKSEIDHTIELEARALTIRTGVEQLREQLDTADITTLKHIIDRAAMMQADAVEIRLRSLAGIGRLGNQLGLYKRPRKRRRGLQTPLQTPSKG